MKMRDLTPSNDMKPEDARSICQYLTATRVKFRRKFHEDYKGVDYTVDSMDTAKRVLNEMADHQHIGHRFAFSLEGTEGKFVARVKDEDDDE